MEFKTLTGALLFLGAVFIAGPLLSIWAVNTLFGLSIGYTMETWVAALLLLLSVKGR